MLEKTESTINNGQPETHTILGKGHCTKTNKTKTQNILYFISLPLLTIALCMLYLYFLQVVFGSFT